MKPFPTLKDFQTWGAQGGKKSSARMTKRQLRERALKGAAARKAKRNGKK